MYRALVIFTTLLTFAVVVIGAFVRLSDAGLGCPDWPGCYGQISPAHAEEHISEAVSAQGGTHGPVSLPKAWKEMIHRYLAGSLGLLLLGIAVLAWKKRRELNQSPWLPTLIVGVVILQAALGMWTVTMLLKPVIVTLHLIGGMTILALLTWHALRQIRMEPAKPTEHVARLRPLLLLGLIAAGVQIVLGGWVSSNYAALACTDLPTCHGAWMPDMDFDHAFHVFRELGMTAQGDLLPMNALVAIHWMHRVGAVILSVLSLYIVLRLMRFADLRRLGWLLAIILVTQFSLGLLNVFLSLPLPIAAAHNAGAAALLVTYVVLNYAAHLAAVSRFRFV
ncbi:MAG TPA: COX15/CtaA family protein [Burkholderiales bacterium]|nr:COX15/CtaA family protein [Burkholderiales bacterium]